MIEIALYENNRLVLKGQSLDSAHSHLTIQPNGWFISLYPTAGGIHRWGLKTAGPLPSTDVAICKVIEFLADCLINESIHPSVQREMLETEQKFMSIWSSNGLTLAQYQNTRGNGDNRLRTGSIPLKAVQPMGLRTGDVLITGEKVTAMPREGGNGVIIIQLTEDNHTVEIGVPSRIALAVKEV